MFIHSRAVGTARPCHTPGIVIKSFIYSHIQKTIPYIQLHETAYAMVTSVLFIAGKASLRVKSGRIRMGLEWR